MTDIPLFSNADQRHQHQHQPDITADSNADIASDRLMIDKSVTSQMLVEWIRRRGLTGITVIVNDEEFTGEICDQMAPKKKSIGIPNINVFTSMRSIMIASPLIWAESKHINPDITAVAVPR